MALKNFNPTTPSRRSLVLVDRSELHKGSPVKKLTKGLTKTGGRNNKGRTTMWWKGGGDRWPVEYHGTLTSQSTFFL